MLFIEQASFVSDVADDIERYEKEMDASEPDLGVRRRRKWTRVVWASLSLALGIVVTLGLFDSYFVSRIHASQSG